MSDELTFAALEQRSVGGGRLSVCPRCPVFPRPRGEVMTCPICGKKIVAPEDVPDQPCDTCKKGAKP